MRGEKQLKNEIDSLSRRGSTHFNNKFHFISFIIAARGPHEVNWN